MANQRRGPDNSVRFAISGLVNTAPWANVFHAQLTTTSQILQADLDAWLTYVSDEYKTTLGTLECAIVSYSLAKATLYVPGGLVMQSQHTMTGAGTQGGTAVNDNSCAIVVSWNTNVYWRGGKPRTYLPGVTTGAINAGNVFGASTITAVQTAGQNFIAAINGHTQGTITGSTLGFVSFFSGGVLLQPGVFHPVTGAKCHPRVGNQRRRLGRWVA